MRTYRSRRLALQALCCLDAQGNKVWDLVDDFVGDSDEPPEVIAAARKLTIATFDRRSECDAILSRHARHWDLARLAMVDRNILRQTVLELLEGQTPPKAAISEALHLAREFSTAESPRFVNGVLDAVARELNRDMSRDSRDKDRIDEQQEVAGEGVEELSQDQGEGGKEDDFA